MGSVGFGMGVGGGGGGENPPPFSPTDVAGLVLWLKADSLSLNDNDPVSTWTDSSGSGNNATGSLTARPLYKTNVVNSLPVVRFDGIDDTLAVARHASLEPNNVTILAVVRAAAAPPAFKYLLSKVHTAGDHASYALLSGVAADAGPFVHVATTGQVFGAAVDGDVVFNGEARILGMRADGSTLGTYFNGGTNGTATAVGNIQYNAFDLYVGSFSDTLGFAAFDLGELLIYNTALSDADRWRVQGYLGERWAIP